MEKSNSEGASDLESDLAHIDDSFGGIPDMELWTAHAVVGSAAGRMVCRPSSRRRCSTFVEVAQVYLGRDEAGLGFDDLECGRLTGAGDGAVDGQPGTIVDAVFG